MSLLRSFKDILFIFYNPIIPSGLIATELSSISYHPIGIK